MLSGEVAAATTELRNKVGKSTRLLAPGRWGISGVACAHHWILLCPSSLEAWWLPAGVTLWDAILFPDSSSTFLSPVQWIPYIQLPLFEIPKVASLFLLDPEVQRGKATCLGIRGLAWGTHPELPQCPLPWGNLLSSPSLCASLSLL